MRLRFEPQVLGLLEGSIDMHIHSAPDIYSRILNDIELARQAQQMGMRAILVKNHFGPTAGRARLAADETGFPVFGAIALNHTVGGLNPHAVDFCLKMGAKVVWLPTLHAQKFLENKSHVKNLSQALGEDIQPIYLLDEDGGLKEEMYKILGLIAQWDAILATGHVSIPEARVVVQPPQGLGHVAVSLAPNPIGQLPLRGLVASHPGGHISRRRTRAPRHRGPSPPQAPRFAHRRSAATPSRASPWP